MFKKKSNKKKQTFSKSLLIQESILIWIVTIALLVLTFYCVASGFFGELPWLVGIAGFPWAAYGVSQACYYEKSKKENTEGGVIYMQAVEELRKKKEEASSINDEDPVG